MVLFKTIWVIGEASPGCPEVSETGSPQIILICGHMYKEVPAGEPPYRFILCLATIMYDTHHHLVIPKVSL